MANQGFDSRPDPKDPSYWSTMRRYVVKEHHATRLHWDFRLEMAGVLKSWVVPKGPSLDPNVARRAVQVGDHSLEYLLRAGTIPEGFYGAGELYVWDADMYRLNGPDPQSAWVRGDLLLSFYGRRMKGSWRLSRLLDDEQLWMLQKCEDEFAVRGHTAEIIGTGTPAVAPVPAPTQMVLGYTEDEMRQTLPEGKPGHRRRRRRSR